jgi:predicted O-methyltransferase YrrM
MIFRNLISRLRSPQTAGIVVQEEEDTSVDQTINTAHPNGHFYSPVTDPEEILADADRIWAHDITSVAGIDLNETYHEYVLGTLFPQYFAEFDYAEDGEADELLSRFYIKNSQFSWLDARTLFVLLREWKPAKIIEVGSGYSTMLMADVNRRFLSDTAEIVAIEPFPRPFLKNLASVNLIQEKVQHVALDVFAELAAGDVLFIDSSHVSKTGSDVNRLLFEVLPILKPGVRIHVHDIFLPVDYPKNWVIDENRSWNEQYVLRSLLMYSTRFRVLFGCMNAYMNHKNLLSAALRRPSEKLYGGSSIWLEVVG